MKSGRFTVLQKAFSLEENTNIGDAVLFVGEALRRLGVGDRSAVKTEMAVEETALLLQRNAPAHSVLQVRIGRFFGDLSVTLTMAGEEFDPFAYDEEQSEDAIRSVFLRSFGENYKYRYKHHENRARILVKKRERSTLVYTLVAMALGLMFGLLASFALPAGLTEGICTYVLQPVKTVFMNALKIIIAPVVFFSIVTCISQFSSIAELGKMGAKVMGMYTMTTVIAVCLGIVCFQAFHPGAFGFALAGGMEQAAISVDTGVDTSLLSTIVNIVPSNFLAPFLESDTLQIIFLAVICGVAVGMIGEYAAVLKEFFEACNSLFLTITTIFSKAIPLAVFASMALLIVEVGGQSLLPLLGYAGVVILAVMLMIGIYGLLIAVMARLNPVTFFRKNREGMLTSFTLASSSAAMPVNLRTCTDKLGISPKVCNFSIPLGATVNMDGACIGFSVTGLFLARAYGVTVPTSALFSLAVTIILLSLGCPGVPGAGLVCLGVVLETLHVPVEAIGLIIAIDPILDMFVTMSNTTGDVTAALIVAKSEKLLDEDVYNSRQTE